MKKRLGRNLFFTAFILIHFSCKSSLTQNSEKVKEKYFQMLSIVEEYTKTNKLKDSRPLQRAVSSLESLTDIKSNYTIGIDVLVDPTKQNLKDWTSWYSKNKDYLYWDEEEQIVKLKNYSE